MHIETSQVIFITNLLIDFYMYERFVLNGLNNGSNESDITFTIFKVLRSLDGTSSSELLIYMELSESAKPHTTTFETYLDVFHVSRCTCHLTLTYSATTNWFLFRDYLHNTVCHLSLLRVSRFSNFLASSQKLFL